MLDSEEFTQDSGEFFAIEDSVSSKIATKMAFSYPCAWEIEEEESEFFIFKIK